MTVAWIALLSWPVVALCAFRALSPAAALSVSLIGGYLLLPEMVEFDLPVLPALDKTSIPALAALVLALGATSGTRGWLPRDPVLLVCLGMFLLGGIGTALTNTDPIGGSYPRLGTRPYDGFSLGLEALLAVTPFLLARRYLASEEAMRRFLAVLVVAACGYAVLALYEVRMSPQLNNMVYGFFPHSWLQHIRGGGFRPLVFLNHGLLLSIFLTTAAIAAAGLSRTARPAWGVAVAWISGTIVLSKSLGALFIAVLFVPVALIASARMRLLVAVAVAGVVVVYPVMRSADLVPTDATLSLAMRLDDKREASLRTRFDSEDALLARAAERPVFGWGRYGRERPYDEDGREISTSDGFWVITFGQKGWVGYLGVFGLLCWPLLSMGLLRRPPPAVASVAALALAANLVDLIPNSGLTPITWLLAGSLAGMRERLRAGVADAAVATAPPPARSRRAFARSHDAPEDTPAPPRHARDFGPPRRDRAARPAPARRAPPFAREHPPR